MRLPLATLSTLVLASTALGCGSADTRSSAATSSAVRLGDPGTTVAAPPRSNPLAPRGDGDADNPGDIDGDAEKTGNVGEGEYRDNDEDHDRRSRESGAYHDRDDRHALAFGHPASVAQRRAIVAVVYAYYVAAATGDGGAACALLPPRMASLAAQEYGGGDAPAYLRGASGCPELLSKLFAHLRVQLSGPVHVTDARVNGSYAEAFLASPTMLASELPLVREGRSWRVQSLVSEDLS